MHTVKRIYPCIAVYKAIAEVTGKPEAGYQMLHDYYTGACKSLAKTYRGICRIPFVYRTIPGIFESLTRSMFGEKSGFRLRKQETTEKGCFLNVTECPYNNCCVKCGCGELTTVFCDSDDVSYGNMHPKLSWERTKTLGRGNECCNFILQIK